MNLENLKKKILEIRTECYKKQKKEMGVNPVTIKYKFNSEVTFFAVDSGYSIVLSHSKKRRNFQLLADQWVAWIKNNLNTISDSILSSPEYYNIKDDGTKYYMHIFTLAER